MFIMSFKSVDSSAAIPKQTSCVVSGRICNLLAAVSSALLLSSSC